MKRMIVLACLMSSVPALAQYQIVQPPPPPGIIMDNKGYYGNGSTQQQLIDTTQQRIDSYHQQMGYGKFEQQHNTQKQYQLGAESNRITNRAMVDGLSYDRAAALERAYEGLRGR